MNKFNSRKNAKLLAIFLSVLLVGACSDQSRVITRVDKVCDKETVDKRASFILECLNNANPKSDEEPEDWIYMCRRMAEKTYCEMKEVEVTQWKEGGSNFWRDGSIIKSN